MAVVTVMGPNNQVIQLTVSDDIEAAAQALGTLISAGVANGSVVPAPDDTAPPVTADDGEYVLTLDGSATLPAGYNVLVENAPHAATVVGAAASVLGGAANLTYDALAPTNLIAGGGNNTILDAATVGGSTFDLGDGNNTVLGGGPHDSIAVGNGDNALFSAPMGQDTISAGTGANVVALSGGLNQVDVAGASTLVGTGGGSIFVSGNSTVTSELGGPADILLGANDLAEVVTNATVFGSNSGPATLAGGSNTTITGVGGSGPMTTFSAGRMAFYGGSGPDNVVDSLSVGGNTFIAGSGNATITGSQVGGDSYGFVNGSAGGKVTIYNFTNNDAIGLFKYGMGEAATAVDNQSLGAGGLTITLSDKTTITFVDLTTLMSTNVIES